VLRGFVTPPDRKVMLLLSWGHAEHVSVRLARDQVAREK
jgi:hypothetical protein